MAALVYKGIFWETLGGSGGLGNSQLIKSDLLKVYLRKHLKQTDGTSSDTLRFAGRVLGALEINGMPANSIPEEASGVGSIRHGFHSNALGLPLQGAQNLGTFHRESRLWCGVYVLCFQGVTSLVALYTSQAYQEFFDLQVMLPKFSWVLKTIDSLGFYIKFQLRLQGLFKYPFL